MIASLLPLILAPGLAAASGDAARETTLRAEWPDCGGCGIDLDQVRWPLLEYAHTMGAEGPYVQAIGAISSYNCPAPEDSRIVKGMRRVRSGPLMWKTWHDEGGITCVARGGVQYHGIYRELSYEEGVILLAYAMHSFPPDNFDYCVKRAAPVGDDAPTLPAIHVGRPDAPPVEFGHPERRLAANTSIIFGHRDNISIIQDRMLTLCEADDALLDGGGPFEAIDITSPIPPLSARIRPIVRHRDASAQTRELVTSWVSSRGNMLGTGLEVDVSGLLRGGAQTIFSVFNSQVEIHDPEDVDFRAIIASGTHVVPRTVVGLGPWGELNLPRFSECIVDLADGRCEVAVRWDTDEAESPVVRHVVTGETLATGESGSIVARLGADPAGERIELVDIDSRILDRQSVRVTSPVGEISATQSSCGEPSTSADDDAESCTVRVAWACWKAPEASVWRVGIDPPAAPVLLVQGETESALDDQVPMNTSVLYEFRQKASYDSGLLASTDTVHVRASQDSLD